MTRAVLHIIVCEKQRIYKKYKLCKDYKLRLSSRDLSSFFCRPTSLLHRKKIRAKCTVEVSITNFTASQEKMYEKLLNEILHQSIEMTVVNKTQYHFFDILRHKQIMSIEP